MTLIKKVTHVAVCDTCGAKAPSAKTRRKALRNAFGRGFSLHRPTGTMQCIPCRIQELRSDQSI